MGRATNNQQATGADMRSTVETSQPQVEGEIGSLAESPLGAGNIDDFAAVAAKAEAGSGFGDQADERAIRRISAKLSKSPSYRNVSADVVADKAESLYAAICQQAPTAGAEQLAKFAELVGEQPSALRARLSE